MWFGGVASLTRRDGSILTGLTVLTLILGNKLEGGRWREGGRERGREGGEGRGGRWREGDIN